jgi:hypothetical protein
MLQRPVGLGRDDKASAARQPGERPDRFRQHVRHRPPGTGALALDLLALLLRHRAYLEQAVDEQPQARLGRQAAGGGVGRVEQAGFLQILHDVADRGRRQRHAQPARNRARPDRLARLDIGVDDVTQYFERTLVQIGDHDLGTRLRGCTALGRI